MPADQPCSQTAPPLPRPGPTHRARTHRTPTHTAPPALDTMRPHRRRLRVCCPLARPAPSPLLMQDSQDPNPLIRALAVRTMGCIRVDKITEYLCDPLQRCLKVRAMHT